MMCTPIPLGPASTARRGPRRADASQLAGAWYDLDPRISPLPTSSSDGCGVPVRCPTARPSGTQTCQQPQRARDSGLVTTPGPPPSSTDGRPAPPGDLDQPAQVSDGQGPAGQTGRPAQRAQRGLALLPRPGRGAPETDPTSPGLRVRSRRPRLPPDDPDVPVVQRPGDEEQANAAQARQTDPICGSSKRQQPHRRQVPAIAPHRPSDLPG